MIEKLRNYCGFYKREWYSDYPPDHTCQIRHVDKGICTSVCSEGTCPILKIKIVLQVSERKECLNGDDGKL